MKERTSKILSWIGRRFFNFVLKNRLGKKNWSARIILWIIGFFQQFERYINTGDVGNFDHFIPQFLLRQFKIGTTGEIYVYKFSSRKILPLQSIRKTAGSIDYHVSKAGGLPSDFENKKIFGEFLEPMASKVIKIINTNNLLELTYLEQIIIATFISFQITRVPAFRKSLLHFFSLGYSKGLIALQDFGDKDILFKKVVRNEIGITYEQFLTDNASTTVDGGKQQLILLSSAIASEICEKVYRSNLHILEIPQNSSDEFVLSDNPVVFLDMDRQHILFTAPWWEVGERDFWIFMPISPKKGIFYCKSKKIDGPIINDSHHLVGLFNYGQYLCCEDEIFSKNKETIERHLRLYAAELRKFGRSQ